MQTIKKLPGPVGLPLIGNSLQLKPSLAYQQLCEWADRYGSIYSFRIGRRRILVICDATLISELLRNRPEKFRRWNKMEELGLEVVPMVCLWPRGINGGAIGSLLFRHLTISMSGVFGVDSRRSQSVLKNIGASALSTGSRLMFARTQCATPSTSLPGLPLAVI